MNNKLIRVIAAVCVWLMVWGGAAGQLVYAASIDSGTITGYNDYVQYTVKASNGRFSIRNTAGDPSRSTDNDKPLLYNGKEPETSFATLQIDGKDYIYGNNYGFLHMDGTFLQAPHSDGGVNTSVWKLGSVTVQQTLEIVSDTSNPNAGNVRVSYKVTNEGGEDKQIGTRLLLDTMLGTNDGPSFWAGSAQQAITKETRLTGSDVPTYWRSVDNVFNPAVFSYGLLGGWGNAKPDALVFGHWNRLSETKWDAQPNAPLDFTNVNNEYGSADSAVALYWNPVTVPAGSSRTFETYYGAGDFTQASADSAFNLKTFAPKQLTVNTTKDGYAEDEFEISAEVDNTLAAAADLTNVKASLILEDGLQAADGSSAYQTAAAIRKDGTYTFTWKVKATPQSAYAVKQYRVDIKADAMKSSVTGGGYILLPGIQGDPPDLQFQQVGPNTVYDEGTRYLTIKGQGFDVLKDKSRWTMTLANTITGAAEKIPASGIVVSDDTNMLVKVEGKQDPGNYQLIIQHTDFGTQHIQQTFQMSDDPKYMGHYYGLLAITKTAVDDDFVYNIVSLNSEDALNDFKEQLSDDESILVELRGDVMEKENESGQTEYVVNTDANPAVLNSVVTYKGAPMTIVKNPSDSQHIRDYVSVTGSGSLHISGGMEFWNDAFSIEMKDGDDYALDADDDQEPVTIELTGLEQSAKMISGFAIEINNAILQDKAVSFSGAMALSFMEGDKKDEKKDHGTSGGISGNNSGGTSNSGGNEEEEEEEDEDNGLSASVDNILFGENEDHTVGFQGIDTTVAIKLPEGMLGGMFENGMGASLTINTIDQIYSVDMELQLKVLEFHGLLTIAIQDGSPEIDDLFISGGVEPGIMLAPGLFLVKVGGGVEDISSSSEGPGKVVLEAAVKMVNVLEGDFTVKASKMGLSLSGELEIEKIPFLEEVSADLQWGDPAHLELSAALNIVDVIVGEAYIYISGDEFEGYAKAAVLFPEEIPFIGGEALAGAELGVSSESIWGSVELIGIPFGIRYYWGQGVEFSDAGGAVDTDKLYAVMLKDKNGKPVKMVAGTNFTKMNEIYANIKRDNAEVHIASYPASSTLQPTGSTSAPATEHTVMVSDQDLALFEMSYTSEQAPSITITDPDGNPYALIEDGPNANYLTQTIPADKSSSGQVERRIFVSVKTPANGAWEIVSDQPVTLEGYDVAPAPKLGEVHASKVDDRHVTVEWSTEYADQSHISLSLAQNEAESGTLLADQIQPADGHATVTIPAETPTGDYQIRVALSDEQYGHQTALTETVHLVDQNVPDPVTEINAVQIGDGKLDVTWTPPASDGTSGYYLEVYDEQGNKLDTFGERYVKADQTEAVIGGQYTDQQTGKRMGLEPGHTYQIGVMAERTTEDGALHYSEAALSAPIQVPVPNPAHLAITYGNDFKTMDEQGNPKKITNQSAAVLHFEADQNVTTTVKVNGVVQETREGSEWDLSIPVTDGDYRISFDSVNGQGDTSETSAAFTVDKTAPPLMIAPLQQAATGGAAVIAGTTEQDAVVTVDGNPVVVDQEGHFSTSVQLGDSWSKQVHIQAVDRAGNTSDYDTEILNTGLKPLAKVALKPYQAAMKPGDSQGFELEGFDQDGGKVPLDESHVKWTILSGGAAASITGEGLLQTTEAGDVIVTASYATTDSFAFEDAAVLTVKSDTASPDPGDSSGGNDSGSHHDDDDDKSSGSIESPAPVDTPTGQELDQSLRDILASIIAKNQHLKLLGQYSVTPGHAQTVPLGEEGSLRIPDHVVMDEDAVAISVADANPADPNGSAPAGMIVHSQMYNIQFAKTDASLPQPVQLTLHYDPASVQKPEQLGIYRYNPVFGKWQYVDADIDRDAHTVSANVDRLGTFAVMENPALTEMVDMPGRWSDQAVHTLLSLDLASGVEIGGEAYFQPERQITRLEFSKLIVESMKHIQPLKDAGEPPFADWTDIPDWGKPYAQAAYANNWMTGTTGMNGTVFDSQTPLTRAEAAAIVGRTLDKQAADETSFADSADIPQWAAPYIGTLMKEGILSGYPDHTFRPDAVLTREEAAALIVHWIDSSRFQ